HFLCLLIVLKNQDEPTTGLDAVSKRKLWTVIQAARNQGITIILTSHSYSISQTTLEQVFVLLVKEHENEQQMRSPIINFDGGSAVKTGVPVSVMRRTTTEQNGDEPATGNIVTRL
ncbi:unnamed protein product, partial [Didymodactylos carnosus]